MGDFSLGRDAPEAENGLGVMGIPAGFCWTAWLLYGKDAVWRH
jgi:hypothetical protein